MHPHITHNPKPYTQIPNQREAKEFLVFREQCGRDVFLNYESAVVSLKVSTEGLGLQGSRD